MALPPHLADLEGRLASRVDEALAGFRRAFETRLRGATERLLAEATDVPQPVFEGLFADVERAALDEAPRQEGAAAAVASLVDAARAFDRASSQGDVLISLVGAGRSAAERLALLLVRDERLVAFESAGCDGRLVRGQELAFQGVLLEQLDASSGCRALSADAADAVAEQLGLESGGNAVVVPLVLRDRIAALLWADRKSGAPDLASLRLLAAMAAQRLELQALSSRSYTPTLYDDDAAPGGPLPHWSALPPETPALDKVSSLQETGGFEIVAVESEPGVAERFEAAADGEGQVESHWAPRRPFGTAGELEVEPRLETGGELEESPVEFELEPHEPAEAAAPTEPPWPLAPAPLPESPAAFAADDGRTELAPPWAGSTIEIEAAGEAVAELFEAAPEGIEVAASEPAPAFSWQEEELPPASASEPEPESSPFAFEAQGEASELLDAPAEFEPEPESPEFVTPEPGPEAAPESLPPDPPTAAPWTEPAVQGDVLRTLRLPIPNFPLAGGERAPEETTAPVRVREVTPSQASATQGASTHEFPAPGPALPLPPLTDQDSASELEATSLSRRLPALSAEPPLEGAPPARPTVPFQPFAPPAPLAPPPAPVEDPMERTASRMRSTEVAPPPDLQGPGRAFLSGRAQRLVADQPTHEEAKRLARLLISEIKLYNEEQVLEGRRNRDLYHRLKDDIDRSRQIYEERVDPAVRQSSDFFQQELVRSLAGGDPRALGI